VVAVIPDRPIHMTKSTFPSSMPSWYQPNDSRPKKQHSTVLSDKLHAVVVLMPTILPSSAEMVVMVETDLVPRRSPRRTVRVVVIITISRTVARAHPISMSTTTHPLRNVNSGLPSL
jgi:hypothetical protein